MDSEGKRSTGGEQAPEGGSKPGGVVEEPDEKDKLLEDVFETGSVRRLFDFCQFFFFFSLLLLYIFFFISVCQYTRAC